MLRKVLSLGAAWVLAVGLVSCKDDEKSGKSPLLSAGKHEFTLEVKVDASLDSLMGMMIEEASIPGIEGIEIKKELLDKKVFSIHLDAKTNTTHPFDVYVNSLNSKCVDLSYNLTNIQFPVTASLEVLNNGTPVTGPISFDDKIDSVLEKIPFFGIPFPTTNYGGIADNNKITQKGMRIETDEYGDFNREILLQNFTIAQELYDKYGFMLSSDGGKNNGIRSTIETILDVLNIVYLDSVSLSNYGHLNMDDIELNFSLTGKAHIKIVEDQELVNIRKAINSLNDREDARLDDIRTALELADATSDTLYKMWSNDAAKIELKIVSEELELSSEYFACYKAVNDFYKEKHEDFLDWWEGGAMDSIKKIFKPLKDSCDTVGARITKAGKMADNIKTDYDKLDSLITNWCTKLDTLQANIVSYLVNGDTNWGAFAGYYTGNIQGEGNIKKLEEDIKNLLTDKLTPFIIENETFKVPEYSQYKEYDEELGKGLNSTESGMCLYAKLLLNAWGKTDFNAISTTLKSKEEAAKAEAEASAIIIPINLEDIRITMKSVKTK